jgi:protein-S-isoprenylcysteine O-methyltransferase Ste14
VSRLLVTVLFGAFTLAAGSGAVSAWGDAVAEPGIRPTALAAHWTLKLGVVLAFCVFVFLREPSKRPSREPVAFLACAAAILAVIALREPPAQASTTLVVAGELVTLAFGAWLLASVLALGRCFGVLPEARGLVTHGPYRVVRHPVYLGELGAAAGLVLAAPTAWNVGVLAVFLFAQAVRMRLEEQALATEFPEYAAYAARTPRLVPRIRLAGAQLQSG